MPFQICSKNLFFTYAECPIPKEELYDYLSETFDPIRICVAQELHKNGHPHLHAFMELKDQFRTRDSGFADFQGYHGNYQGCRSAKNVLKYCTKEDDYQANFDVAQALAKSEGEKTILGKRLMEGEDLCEILKEYPKYIFGFKKLKEDIDCWKEVVHYKSIELEVPDEIPNPWGLRLFTNTDLKKCHYWFYSSQPNKGKTTGVIIPLTRDHHATMFTPKAQYHQIRKETKVICIDELNKGQLKYNTLNSMCDGTYSYRVFMQGCIKLVEKPLIVICSNFSIQEVFPFKYELVQARFIELDVSNLVFV